MSTIRQADATWVIPTENEWYKAAYHYNDGVTGNYFNYPTSSNSIPSNDLIAPDPGNNATFYDNGHTLGSPYWRTEVGAHENSDSPYGTFDMGGNVWDWNEATISDSYRGVRGGSFDDLDGFYLASSCRDYAFPPYYEGLTVGFRVAYIPEPVTLLLLGLGAVMLRKRK
ncbi:MAG: SUMF1/EgtB/PvdO family nonheme iron enzyme [Sedimentisphaerales bacterium]|nr:SUMF1/EgtB/PvdO family nonheme iron enzyme [Sedimentisphaerales bacterium]